MWTMQDDLEHTLFTNSIRGMKDLKVTYLDVADIHEFNENSNNFFSALSNSEQLELFDLPVIQSLIKFKWPLVKKYYIMNNFVPALIQLISMIVFSQYILHDKLY